MAERKVTSMSDEEKARVMKVVGADLSKLERKYGEAVVRYVVNRRHDERVEKAKLQKEKAKLEKRLAEIGAA
jgi:hypothetical protein